MFVATTLLKLLWSGAAQIRADPTGAATTGWEAVAGIGSVVLGAVFLFSVVLMLGSPRGRQTRRPGYRDDEETAARRLFGAQQ